MIWYFIIIISYILVWLFYCWIFDDIDKDTKSVGKDKYGYYNNDTYANLIAITIKETGAQPQIGHYRWANEISFTSDDRVKSFKFAELHNQDSVYKVGKKKNKTEFLGRTKGPKTWKRNKKYNYVKGD